MTNQRSWFSPGEGRWLILIRLMLFGVFFFEGIQKRHCHVNAPGL